MYARNAWYVAAWSNELADDTPTAMKILGEPIVIYRSSSTGKVAVLADRCVHRLAPLSLGRCEGDKLRCMYHGLLFAPDGRVVDIPGQDKIPPQAKVRAYPAIERASWLWVWMGEPDEADETLIPASIGPDCPDYIMGQGHLDYQAEASLINDNLLDFSHLTFVHANSFEAPDDFAESLPKVETIERGVRYSRWMVDAQGPIGRQSDELIDNYMCYEFVIPGVLLMWNGSFPRGTAEKCGFGPPERETAIASVTFTSQAVTPMEEGRARYFFCWGPHRKHGDEKLKDFLMGIAAKAFAEDKTMIEAQYRNIASMRAPSIMPTAHDKGLTIFNRMVEKLVRDEAQAGG